MSLGTWISRTRHRRAARALERQLAYQRDLSRKVLDERPALSETRSSSLRELQSQIPTDPQSRVVEVGSGAKGLLFHLPPGRVRLAIDPLAVDYKVLRRDATNPTMCAALGEHLPLRTASCDVVICDNVIDHAERPSDIVRELVRALKPGGALYFCVNVHHGVYSVASKLHGLLTAIGIPVEIPAFADHTVHLTPRAVRRMFAALPIDVVSERDGVSAARDEIRRQPQRHFGDGVKRVFFKNARYVIVARKAG